MFAHYNAIDSQKPSAKESFLNLADDHKNDLFEEYESDYNNSGMNRGGSGVTSMPQQYDDEPENHYQQDTAFSSVSAAPTAQTPTQEFEDDDEQLLLEADAPNSEEYDSYHEEDEYITQYIPYVNQTYRTVGDFQFDEAMKKLTTIFHKTARVDEDLRNAQQQGSLSNSFGSSATGSTNNDANHYGVKVHQQLMEEKRRQDIAINLGDKPDNAPWRKLESFSRITPNKTTGAGRLWNPTPGSPEMSSATQRSMFSMIQRNQGEIDEETFYRQLEEDDTIREKLDDAIHALEQQGVSLKDAHYTQIPKPKSVAISERQWEVLVQRLQRPSSKKLKKIESILREKQEKEEAECTYRPNLCEKSLQIASGQKSIFDTSRIDDERHDRKLRVETERRKLDEKRNQQNIFKPKINKSSQSIIRGVETFEAWEKNKQDKIKNFQESNLQRESEECTFNPSLSERSRKIVARKNFQKSVWDRNYEFEFERIKKLNQMMEEQENQIETTPEITEKAKRIKRKEKIGDRLHSLAMETLSRKKQKREELYGMYYHNEESNLLRESLSMSGVSPPVTSRSYMREIERNSSVHRELDYVDDGNYGDTEYDDLNTSYEQAASPRVMGSLHSARTDKSKKYRKKASTSQSQEENMFVEPVLETRQANQQMDNEETQSQQSLLLWEENSGFKVEQLKNTLSKYHSFRRQSSGAQFGA